jgi:hypothetical protein
MCVCARAPGCAWARALVCLLVHVRVRAFARVCAHVRGRPVGPAGAHAACPMRSPVCTFLTAISSPVRACGVRARARVGVGVRPSVRATSVRACVRARACACVLVHTPCRCASSLSSACKEPVPSQCCLCSGCIRARAWVFACPWCLCVCACVCVRACVRGRARAQISRASLAHSGCVRTRARAHAHARRHAVVPADRPLAVPLECAGVARGSPHTAARCQRLRLQRGALWQALMLDCSMKLTPRVRAAARLTVPLAAPRLCPLQYPHSIPTVIYSTPIVYLTAPPQDLHSIPYSTPTVSP